MTICERIIKIVDEQEKGNMSKLAAKINVTPAYISKLKKFPDSIPSDRTIKDICKTYKVNETWLRTGEGDMFAPPTQEQRIADVVGHLMNDDNEFKNRLIEAIAGLSDEQIDALRVFAQGLLENTKGEE